jgi:hypothetical protein
MSASDATKKRRLRAAKTHAIARNVRKRREWFNHMAAMMKASNEGFEAAMDRQPAQRLN